MRYLFTMLLMIASISASVLSPPFAFAQADVGVSTNKMSQKSIENSPSVNRHELSENQPAVDATTSTENTRPFEQNQPEYSPQIAAVEPVVGKHAGVNTNAATMILTLLMVLVLIVVCAMMLKRFQPSNNQTKGLKVVTSLSLGAKERVIVIQVGEKQQLLGVTSHQITLLDTLEEPIKPHKDMTTELSQSIVSIFQKHVVNKPNNTEKPNRNPQANSNNKPYEITPLKKESAQHDESL